MPVFRVIGKIWPGLDDDLNVDLQLDFTNEHNIFGKVYTVVNVYNKSAEAKFKCEASVISEHLGYIVNIVRDYVNGILYVAALQHGISMHFFPEFLINEKGQKLSISTGRDQFSEISARLFSKPERFGQIVDLISHHPRSFKVLSDLVNAVDVPHTCLTLCASAVEAARIALSPDIEGKDASWEAMRHKLNISKKYLTNITAASREPRHGSFDFIPHTIIEPVVDATCVVVVRYFEYCFAGVCDHLPLDEFPVI